MVQKYTLIILLLLLLPIGSFASEVKDLSYSINYAQIPPDDYMVSEEKCLLKAYWLSIEGSNKQSNKLLNSCSECLSKTPEYRYYCYLTKANNFFWKGHHKAASRVYFSMINDKYIGKALDATSIKSLGFMGQSLSHVNVKKKNRALHLEYIDEEFIVGITNDYLADTGATFGSIISTDCIKRRNIGSLSVAYDGSIVESTSCLVEFKPDDILPFSISNKNIVGQIYLSSFNDVLFSQKPSISSQKLYKDGSLVFFLMDLSYKNNDFKKLKVCLDSGSKKTALMPPVYKALKTIIAKKPIKKLSFQTPFGRGVGLVKLLDGVTLYSNKGRSLLISKVPVFIRNFSFNQCDVVLGAKQIYKLVNRIDYTNNRIYLYL